VKVGDLVGAMSHVQRSAPIEGYIGIIVGFDSDDDPVVYWTHTLGGDHGRQFEYRSHVYVLASA